MSERSTAAFVIANGLMDDMVFDSRHDADRAAQCAISALRDAGFAIVPVSPVRADPALVSMDAGMTADFHRIRNAAIAVLSDSIRHGSPGMQDSLCALERAVYTETVLRDTPEPERAEMAREGG